MSCGVGHRGGSDPALLWLWCRPVATDPIRPLAWGPPYIMGVALKRKEKKNYAKLGNDNQLKQCFPSMTFLKKANFVVTHQKPSTDSNNHFGQYILK